MAKDYGQYTAEDKAKALALLVMNDGNELRTSEELNIPNATLRYWAKQEREGKTSTTVLQLKQQVVSRAFADTSTRIRTKALDRLEQMLDDPEQKFNPQQLATVVGILTDKLDRLNTLTLTHTETTKEPVDEHKIAEGLSKFLEANSESATERRNVIDAEMVEQSTQDLAPEKE